jgi:protocatechuate 3,4-dioxygenase beta subunit
MGYLDHISQMTVSGVVRQVNGSPVSNATVTLTNAYDATESQQTRTDDKGKYKFNEIQVGDYVLYTAKSGFYPSATTFRLDNGERQAADLKLEVAPTFAVLGGQTK